MFVVAAPQLTKREREILRLVPSNLSNKELAKRFGITERTMKYHMANLFRKLGVEDRQALNCLLCGWNAS